MPELRLVEEKGPRPFVTFRIFRTNQGDIRVWSSRHHRKGLPLRMSGDSAAFASSSFRGRWRVHQLNWWIGTVFAIGSAIFALASVLALFPSFAKAISVDSKGINTLYFAGTIPFTTAAFLQLYQAANVAVPNRNGEVGKQHRRLLGWRPHEIGWLGSALQFIGTLLFNVSLLDAMLPKLGWLEQNFAIWVPDVLGSTLFLASGYLAYIEIGSDYWTWDPANVSWWVVFVNLLGCIGFMISAIFAFVLPGAPEMFVQQLATGFTLQGAICFLIGSLLMLPETTAHFTMRKRNETDAKI